MLSDIQINIFNYLELIEDEGYDLGRFIRDSESFRRRVSRNFPNILGLSKVDSALYLYGYLDMSVIHREEVYDEELMDCIIHVNELPEISSYKIKELSTLTNTPQKDLYRRAKILLEDLILDSVGDYIYESFGMITMEDIKKMEGGRYFEGLAYKKFGGSLNFYNSYGIDVKLFYLSHEHSRRSYLYHLGKEFEKLVRKYLFPSEPYQVVYKDCIPDFIVDGKWVDIKLSKNTVFLPMDSTINKYLKYTDEILVIYALEEDVTDDFYIDYGFIELLSIDNFYDAFPTYVINEFEDFKRVALEFKEAIK